MSEDEEKTAMDHYHKMEEVVQQVFNDPETVRKSMKGQPDLQGLAAGITTIAKKLIAEDLVASSPEAKVFTLVVAAMVKRYEDDKEDVTWKPIK